LTFLRTLPFFLQKILSVITQPSYHILMSTLIVMTLFGIGFAMFATQNLNPVFVNLGGYSLAGVPLYLVVLGSMLAGILISAVISWTNSIGALMSIKGRDHKIKETEHEVEKLRERLKEMEIENARLQNKPLIENRDRPIIIDRKRDIISRLRQAFP
jgi:uncharacterized integral membrane protein